MSEEKKKQDRPLNQKEVEAMLERGDSFEGLEIGDVDFKEHVFENQVNFVRAKFVGSVDFYFAKFLNDAIFVGAEFSGEGRTCFMGAEFSGEVGADFINVVFSGKGGANFTVAKFSGEGGAYFHSATFSGEGGANFSGAEFSGKRGAMFHGTKFSGNGGADFSWAIFSGEGGVDFYAASFSGTAGVKFTHAKFLCEDRISFEDVSIEKDCIIYFDRVKIKNPKNLFFRDVYLGNTSFYITDIEEFNFKNVKFRKFPPGKPNWFKENILIRRSGLLDEIWNEIAPEDDQREYDEDYYSHVEIIYRQLKRNFEEQRDYDKAGDFHFGELEMRRKRQTKYKKYVSLTAFYKYFSGYGQKWTRALFWFVGFVGFFTFLNLVWLQPIQETKINSDLRSDSNLEETSESVTKFDSFLYTFNTMTLRKDTRFEITDPIGSLIVILQTMIGPVVLALMFLAIRRQFRR